MRNPRTTANESSIEIDVCRELAEERDSTVSQAYCTLRSGVQCPHRKPGGGLERVLRSRPLVAFPPTFTSSQVQTHVHNLHEREQELRLDQARIPPSFDGRPRCVHATLQTGFETGAPLRRHHLLSNGSQLTAGLDISPSIQTEGHDPAYCYAGMLRSTI